MKLQHLQNKDNDHVQSRQEARALLLSGLQVEEKKIKLAGVETTLLQGGAGTPLVLLHGPGESAEWWMRVLPLVLQNYRVIVPDLPGHGASDVAIDKLNMEWTVNWLDDLIDKTCDSPPFLVGHILGGAIAANYVVKNEDKIKQLVLVDSFGLSKFRPSPSFAFGMFKFLARPTLNTYQSFLTHCLYDPSGFQREMAEKWQPFLNYNLSWIKQPGSSKVMKIMMKKLAIPVIPTEKLAAITIPVSLIWGRHDKALKLLTAQVAAERYNWPLFVIDDSRDDPKIERPGAFVDALNKAMNSQESKAQMNVI